MQIINSTTKDIDAIFNLYKIASDYQKPRFRVYWPEFDRNLVETEITENRQWKAIIDDTIACIWATTFNDLQIWEERNKDPSVYIHRIATAPQFRGKHFVKYIVEWVKIYAVENNKQFIRLDTIGENHKLIEYYQTCGFTFLGMFQLKNTHGLPSHYHNESACLFEIDLNNSK